MARQVPQMTRAMARQVPQMTRAMARQVPQMTRAMSTAKCRNGTSGSQHSASAREQRPTMHASTLPAQGSSAAAERLRMPCARGSCFHACSLHVKRRHGHS